MINKLLNFFLLFLIIFLQYGCNTKKIEIGEISNIKYKGVENNAVILDADVFINNPKIFKLKITQIDASVLVSKMKMGKISKIDTLIIPARTQQNQKVRMYLEVTNMSGGLLALIQMLGSKKYIFDFQGQIKIKYFFFTRTINFKKHHNPKGCKKKIVS